MHLALSESRIQAIQSQLEAAGVNGVPWFIKKLRDNAKNPMTIQDLLVEGDTALTFRALDFDVTLQDRPDLMLRFEGHTMYAECRHYQEKTSDSHDEKKLRRAGAASMFVQFGDSEKVQEQILSNLEEKAREYHGQAPFVVVLKSSSRHRVENLEIEGAVHVAKGIAFRDSSHPLTIISAILFLDHHRRAYFFPMISAKNPLPRAARMVLESISCYKPE